MILFRINYIFTFFCDTGAMAAVARVCGFGGEAAAQTYVIT